MPELRELQVAFREAILGGDVGAAARLIAPDGLTPDARLDVYRHHVLTTLTAALESTYAVVSRLVDRRFFAFAADHYLRRHPPESPCLFEYGGAFADFLAAFEPCRHLAYLPDVARLEWAMQAALHADDAVPLDPAQLAAVPAEAMHRATLALDPSASFLRSAWPVDRIWSAHQAPEPEQVDLDAGPVHLEIRRRDDRVTMRRLEPAPHAFRRTLAQGLTLEAAAAAALAIDPSLDLTAAIRELLDERILVGVAVSN